MPEWLIAIFILLGMTAFGLGVLYIILKMVKHIFFNKQDNLQKIEKIEAQRSWQRAAFGTPTRAFLGRVFRTSEPLDNTDNLGSIFL